MQCPVAGGWSSPDCSVVSVQVQPPGGRSVSIVYNSTPSIGFYTKQSMLGVGASGLAGSCLAVYCLTV